jgi:flagellar basal-body rod protein FlgF
MDTTGRLVTQAGLPVMGDGGGEIIIDPEKGEVTIGGDGTISQGAERVGKVGVYTFADAGVLEKAGDNLFRNGSNLAAEPAANASVRQGFLEGSNVKPVFEITRMIEVSRAYEQAGRMIDSGSDLSRRAVERLGKIQ